MKLKLFSTLFTITALLFSQASFGKLVIVLDDGVDQGDLNCKVSVTNTDCGGASPLVSASCETNGLQKCPTNAELRAGCSGAIVVWVSNTALDTEIGTILGLWAGGSGQTSGSYQRTYYNVPLMQTAVLTFTWSTNAATGAITIEIEDVVS